MFNGFEGVSSQLRGLARLLHQLLAPPGETCLTCGTRARLSADYPGICFRCAQQIPWIRSIRCLRCGRGIGCPDCLRPHMQKRSFVCNRSAVQYNALMKEWIGMYKFRGHRRYGPLLTAMVVQAFRAMSEEMNAAVAKEIPALAAQPAASARLRVDDAPHPPVPPASMAAGVHLSAATRRPGSLLRKPLPPWRPDAVTYVPVSGERLAERGFNQAERLAAGLAAAHRMPLVDLLSRPVNTAKQSFKSRAERIETMQHAFALQPDAMQLLADLGRRQRSEEPALSQTPLRLLLVDDIYTTGSTLDACGEVILKAVREAGILTEVYTLTLARS